MKKTLSTGFTLIFNFLRWTWDSQRIVFLPVPIQTSPTSMHFVQKLIRWAYILSASAFTGAVLGGFNTSLFILLNLELRPEIMLLDWIMAFVQVAWQGIAINLLDPKKSLDYLGNMATISLFGAVLLFPLLRMTWYFELGWEILLLGFATVVAFMFLAHIRRCRILGITWKMTASWVLFRSLILVILLFLAFIP